MKMKKMMNKTKWLIFALLFGLLGAHIYHIIAPKSEVIEIEKVDTIQICDTAYITDTLIFQKTKLVPKEVYITKIDTVYDNNYNPIELITENKTYQDTIICDKDTAEFQIFTSGIKSNVDSINLNLRKSNPVITNTITIEKYVKPKKIKITPQLGIGYGLLNKQTDIYLGIGLSYNF